MEEIVSLLLVQNLVTSFANSEEQATLDYLSTVKFRTAMICVKSQKWGLHDVRTVTRMKVLCVLHTPHEYKPVVLVVVLAVALEATRADISIGGTIGKASPGLMKLDFCRWRCQNLASSVGIHKLNLPCVNCPDWWGWCNGVGNVFVKHWAF